MSEENISKHVNLENNLLKRKPEENILIPQTKKPSSNKIKNRESILEKEKVLKYFTSNSNEVIFFKISKIFFNYFSKFKK